jgi:peroxiredoxin
MDGFEQGSQQQNAREFRDKHRLTYPILLDAGDHVAARYGINGWPTNLLIDQAGIVRQIGHEDELPGMEREIDRLLHSQ